MRVCGLVEPQSPTNWSILLFLSSSVFGYHKGSSSSSKSDRGQPAKRQLAGKKRENGPRVVKEALKTWVQARLLKHIKTETKKQTCKAA